MIVGSRVKVTGGEYHGKTGEVSSTLLTGEGDRTRALPTVLLSTGESIEISGELLTAIA